VPVRPGRRRHLLRSGGIIIVAIRRISLFVRRRIYRRAFDLPWSCANGAANGVFRGPLAATRNLSIQAEARCQSCPALKTAIRPASILWIPLVRGYHYGH
jgi:hypothetical protein